ncbi:NADPH-dependent D-xylose reductase II,III [Nephila pilipes]|uniref:NADPH-dependent D-xylose reductase II,III n=1 Tax=Nephila pilipes TaxID=299642 RepID=A0A8X6PA36_NEPPI|nr:NADPH-dependent D-xylose reductase II,III [Nephila pilipes]
MGLSYTRPVFFRAARLNSTDIGAGIGGFKCLSNAMEGRPNIPKVRLNNGFDMPVIGLGVWQNDDKETIERALRSAVSVGYRFFDTAPIYENEEYMGNIFQQLFLEGEVKREDFFLCTKLGPNKMDPKVVSKACQNSLKRLKSDYLDLYLIHFPIPSKDTENEFEYYPKHEEKHELLIDHNVKLEETWKAMERLVEDGLVKSIGLSNCSKNQIERILNVCKIKPANLQIECHPYLPQREMIDFCKSLNIAVTAYSPLGTPGFGPYVKKKYLVDINPPLLFNEEIVKNIAAAKGKTPAQILLRFLIQRGFLVIPKSSNPDHQKENLEVFDFILTREEMEELYKLENNYYRYFPFNMYPNMLTHPEHPFK